MKKKFFLLLFGVGALLVFVRAVSPFAPHITYVRTAELGDVVVVSFLLPVSEQSAKESFRIYPPIGGELVWLEEYRELRFVPREGFDAGTSYMVTVEGQGWLFAQVAAARTRRTFHPAGLPVKFNAQIEGEESIYYITESGLKRRRSKEVFLSYQGNREEDIRSIERETLALYPDNTLIHLENDPDVYKLEDGRVHLIKNAEAFEALGFDWDAIAPVNADELNSYPKGEPISIPTPAVSHQKAVEGKLIDVDLEAMKFTLWDSGKVISEFSVAGKGNPASAPTRKGLFRVLTKEKNHFSSLSRVWMPWSMQYSGDYFIHGWPYWPNGGLISSKYSAGCVRLHKGDAEKVYDFAEVGTPILVH